jgi:DNA invertase Pin-like site-specific DNA recombinase
MKFVGYTRVSSPGQVKDGLGLTTQERRIRKWARDHGHKVIAVCVEKGRSGTLPAEDRPALVDALRIIRTHEADALIVTDLDRLARELRIQEAVLAQVWDSSGKVFTPGGEVLRDDPDDPMRTAMRQMAGVFAQLERAMVVKRLRAGAATKRANGGYAGGGLAYGTASVDGRVVVDPGEARTVERVRELRAAGASYRAICETLTAEGFRPRRAEQWSPMVVRRIATST